MGVSVSFLVQYARRVHRSHFLAEESQHLVYFVKAERLFALVLCRPGRAETFVRLAFVLTGCPSRCGRGCVFFRRIPVFPVKALVLCALDMS